jgi:hypothetical protein
MPPPPSLQNNQYTHLLLHLLPSETALAFYVLPKLKNDNL